MIEMSSKVATYDEDPINEEVSSQQKKLRMNTSIYQGNIHRAWCHHHDSKQRIQRKKKKPLLLKDNRRRMPSVAQYKDANIMLRKARLDCGISLHHVAFSF